MIKLAWQKDRRDCEEIHEGLDGEDEHELVVGCKEPDEKVDHEENGQGEVDLQNPKSGHEMSAVMMENLIRVLLAFFHFNAFFSARWRPVWLDRERFFWPIFCSACSALYTFYMEAC